MKRKIGGMVFILIGIIIAFNTLNGESETEKVQNMMIESLNSSTVIRSTQKEDKHKKGDENTREGTSDDQVDLVALGGVELEQKTNDTYKSVKSDENKKNHEVMPEEIQCIGIIEISKIDLKVAIAEGATLDNLKYSVAHYKETAGIGEVGNCAIAGHRSYAYNEFFNRLDEIEIGDEIKLLNGMEEFIYEVYDTFVVEPTQVEVLDQSEDAELTLITCTPIRVATHRLIIKAKRKGDSRL